MANYKLQYSGAQIDTAIGKALNTNLNNYPTKTEVENKGYLTAEQVNALIDDKLSNVEPGGGSGGVNPLQMLIDNRGMYNNSVDFSNGTSCYRLFAYTVLDANAIETIMSGVDTSGVGDMSYMFQCNEGLEVFSPTFDTSLVIDMSYMFASCTTITEVTLDCSAVENVQNMFSGCTNLYRVELRNLGGRVMSNTSGWFRNCTGLGVLDFRTAAGVPNLTSTNSFTNAATGFEIIVPDNLYDEWVNATNWSSLDVIWVRASEYEE